MKIIIRGQEKICHIKTKRLIYSSWHMSLQMRKTKFKGCSSVGGDVAQLVRASDHHATDAGSIPLSSKGFFSQSQPSVKTLSHVPVHPRVQSHALTLCMLVRDPVGHVRVRWIMETLKYQACTVGWVARLCCSWLSPGKATWISNGRNPTGTVQL